MTVIVSTPSTTPLTACQLQYNPAAIATGSATPTGAATLTAQDDGSLNCALPPPTANCVVINAVQGVAITPVTLTGSGGAGGPYTFTANGTGLSAIGLSISNAGVISCTPTASGTFSYSVTVKDNAGNVGTLNCSVTIAPPPLTAACVTATTGQVGVAYYSQIVASGGTAPYTFALASGSLPGGLTLNPTSGVISGTPTTAGPFSFAVKVTDSTGGTALTFTTSGCGITIAPPPLTALCVTATTGQVGVAYSSAIVANGGTAPYTFTIASGSLPGGLTLNPSTGMISGTPTTAGPFSFSVLVTDSTSGGALTYTTAGCGIAIAPRPLIAACVAQTTGQVGVAYSSSITANGGTAPYTFAVASGALPGGLSLNANTGAITGTPTTAGPFAFSVLVTDSTGGNALTYTVNCGITIAPPPLIASCVTQTNGQVGTGYASSISAVGGTAPYTFTLVSGSLPTGLTLNSGSGLISGVPQVAGPFNFSVRAVTDSTGGTRLEAYTVNCGITIALGSYPALLKLPAGFDGYGRIVVLNHNGCGRWSGALYLRSCCW